jgi:hypothetical protein
MRFRCGLNFQSPLKFRDDICEAFIEGNCAVRSRFVDPLEGSLRACTRFPHTKDPPNILIVHSEMETPGTCRNAFDLSSVHNRLMALDRDISVLQHRGMISLDCMNVVQRSAFHLASPGVVRERNRRDWIRYGTCHNYVYLLYATHLLTNNIFTGAIHQLFR